MYNNIKMWAVWGLLSGVLTKPSRPAKESPMKRQLSLGEYRAIDLALFAVILALFEFLIVRFAIVSVYAVSLAAVITAIVYMRWGCCSGGGPERKRRRERTSSRPERTCRAP